MKANTNKACYRITACHLDNKQMHSAIQGALTVSPQADCQDDHEPGTLRDLSEHGKLGESLGNSVQKHGKTVPNKIQILC